MAGLQKIDIDDFEIVSEDDVTRSFFNDSKFTGSMIDSPKLQVQSEEQQKPDTSEEQREMNMKPDLLNFDEPDEFEGIRGQTNVDIVNDILNDDNKHPIEKAEDSDCLSSEENSDTENAQQMNILAEVSDLNKDENFDTQDAIPKITESGSDMDNVYNNFDRDIDAIFGSPHESNTSTISKETNDEDTLDNVDGSTDLDFGALKGTDHLDVHSSKDKTSLVKKGSLARRKKPTRASIKRNLNNEESKFQDATEPKKSPVETKVNSDDIFISSTSTDGELSPEPEKQKKRSPVMIAMPGMTGLSPDKLKLARTKRRDFETPNKDETDSKQLPVKLPYCSTPKSPEETRDVDAFHTPVLKGVSRNKATTPDNKIETDTFTTPHLKSVSQEKNSASLHSSLEGKTLETNGENVLSDMESHSPFGTPVIKTVSERKTRSTRTDDSDAETKLERPILKKASENTNMSSEVKSEKKSGIFDIPTLKVAEPQTPEPKKEWVIEKPSLRSVATPDSKGRNINDEYENSVFQTPQLRSSKSCEGYQEKKVTKEESQPMWMNEMKLKKTPSKCSEDLSLKQTVDTPSWMKTALDKKARMTEIMSKENADVDKKRLFTDSSLEGRPPKPAPLQESRSDSRENIRNLPNGKSKPVIITELSSSNVDKKSSFKEEGRQSSRDREKYVPSWSRTSLTKQGSVDKQPYLPPMSATLKSDDSIPPWKKELAERKKARRDNDSTAKSTSGTPSDPGMPPWKRELSLKKRTPIPSKADKESASLEPEWKKKADEKRSRLINSGMLEQ